MKNLYAFILSALIGFSANASDHPIDKRMDECIKKSTVNIETRTCIEQASKLWELELATSYKKLIASAQPEDLVILKKSQALWSAHKEQQIKMLSAVYSQKRGTMFPSMYLMDAMEITKSRALELNHLHNIIVNY